MKRQNNLEQREIREIVELLEKGRTIPDKYRFLLFDDEKQTELIWNGKATEQIDIVLPFQTIEQVDEPRRNLKQRKLDEEYDKRGRQTSGWSNKLIWGDNKLILRYVFTPLLS